MGKARYYHDKTKFTQYLFTNPALQRITDKKLQHKEGNYTLEKARKYLLSTNPKEGSHTNIIPPLTKITGSNNHFSLISLDINGLNSPIKRHRQPRYVNRTQRFAVYRKRTSVSKTDTTTE